MKRVLLLDVGRESRRLKEVLVTGKAFVSLSLSSMLFFVLLGAAGIVQQEMSTKPVKSMQGLAATVSSGFFGDMLEMELPRYSNNSEVEIFTGKQISALLLRTLTDINPNDPKSLLAGELPGLSANDAFLIRKGIGTDLNVGPKDHAPLESLPPAVEPTPPQADASQGGATPSPSDNAQQSDDNDDKVVFIYHSHNRESWYPELEDENAKDPNSTTVNISLVGKRLAEKLEKAGVGAMHSDVDYPTAIKDYKWAMSYKYSKKTVKEAMASSKDLKFFFDIHRDSQKRKYTTVDIDGVSYAQVYFIIGQKNPNWEQNEAFATKIHNELEKRYPGISRGIWGKTAASGNAEYNQSLASESVLVEVGGVENTLDESYRTADALAEVISDIYHAAEKVSGSAS